MCRLTGQDHQRRPRQQAQCSRRRGQRGSGRRTLGHTRHTAQCALFLATAPCSLHLQYCKLLLNVFSLDWATTAQPITHCIKCPPCTVAWTPHHWAFALATAPICPTLTLIWRPRLFSRERSFVSDLSFIIGNPCHSMSNPRFIEWWRMRLMKMSYHILITLYRIDVGTDFEKGGGNKLTAFWGIVWL